MAEHDALPELLDDIERLRAELDMPDPIDLCEPHRARIAELETALRDLGELAHAALEKKPTESGSV